MNGDSWSSMDSVIDSPITSSSQSVVGLQTYNSAANLTNDQLFELEKDEFLFDVNTKNSCVRPLQSFVRQFSKSNVHKEFSSFTSVLLSRPRTVDVFFDHPNLNKYSDVVVYEHTRVRASHRDKHDYINASWIDGFREVRKFIVTQSPLDSTVAQFWRMVFERKSRVLVTFVELINEKKEPFVPKRIGETLTFENMTIELVKVRSVRQSYHSVVLKLKKEGTEPIQIILLAHHGWGSAGYPSHPSDILDLLADMNNMRAVFVKSENDTVAIPKGPITVVCFDGLNRSCTLVALDIMCRRLEYSSTFGTPFVDVLDTIARVRMVRAAACPKAEQFIFLSMAILEFAIRQRLIDRDNFIDIDMSGFIVE